MSCTIDSELTPAQFAEQQLTKSLFIEVIRLAPRGADLFITSDSWDELPSLFGERMTIVREGSCVDWRVPLTPGTREFLVRQAQIDDLPFKFVHFFIEVDGAILFSSWDRMASLSAEVSFPEYSRLMVDYAAILMV